MPPQAEQYMQIELDADGDKKQAHQHIAKRLDILLHLQPVLGFRNQHAGNEGPKRQRQARSLGQCGQAKRNQQHIEDKNL